MPLPPRTHAYPPTRARVRAQVAYHDVHHDRQAFNYGQYTVFWDRLFGTFRAHDDFDGVTGRPKAEAGASSGSTGGAARAKQA